MTNHEKIQRMTTEELAEIIQCPNEFENKKIRCNMMEMYVFPRTCKECKVDWLKKEVGK